MKHPYNCNGNWAVYRSSIGGTGIRQTTNVQLISAQLTLTARSRMLCSGSLSTAFRWVRSDNVCQAIRSPICRITLTARSPLHGAWVFI